MGTNQTVRYTAAEERECNCGARFQLICKMLDPRSGRIHRMFKCDCGKRAWEEQRPEPAQAFLTAEVTFAEMRSQGVHGLLVSIAAILGAAT